MADPVYKFEFYVSYFEETKGASLLIPRNDNEENEGTNWIFMPWAAANEVISFSNLSGFT